MNIINKSQKPKNTVHLSHLKIGECFVIYFQDVIACRNYSEKEIKEAILIKISALPCGANCVNLRDGRAWNLGPIGQNSCIRVNNPTFTYEL